ncbi:hypothetical protein Tco_1553990 [Tanacetum coccineum]
MARAIVSWLRCDKLPSRIEDAIVVPPINANNFELKQPLINLVEQNTTFYARTGMKLQQSIGNVSKNFFVNVPHHDKMPRECLAIIESKSKVRYSRNRPNDSRAITNAPSSSSSHSNNFFEIQQIAALLEDKINIRMSRLKKADIGEKNATTPATVKAVEEVCVTVWFKNHTSTICP